MMKIFPHYFDGTDLYMLIIPKEFRAYVKGPSYPQLVSIECCKDCEWIVHANPYRDEVILDRMWPSMAASLDLKVGGYLLFKVTVDGFKLTIYDHITSCQRPFIYSEHTDLY
jgi:predicted Rdx family selenoprotein